MGRHWIPLGCCRPIVIGITPHIIAAISMMINIFTSVYGREMFVNTGMEAAIYIRVVHISAMGAIESIAVIIIVRIPAVTIIEKPTGVRT